MILQIKLEILIYITCLFLLYDISMSSVFYNTGGMGTTYSLPRSPEDYLCNVDEMDTEMTEKTSKKELFLKQFNNLHFPQSKC